MSQLYYQIPKYMSDAGLGMPGATLCIVGSYEPAVELLLLENLQHGSSSMSPSSSSGTGKWRFQPLCRLRGDALSAALSADSAPDSAAAGADIPHSALLINHLSEQGALQVFFATHPNKLNVRCNA